MDKKFMYAGIENEFQIFDKEKEISFHNVWDNLYKQYSKVHISISKTAMRTTSGTAIYIDQESPEVNTPPIRIEPGFATKAATALYLARKELIDFIAPNPNLNLIGYSTHWNISNNMEDNYAYEIMEHVAPALAMFGLNPISSGINLRKKDEGSSRFELLTDYIEEEEQTTSMLLLYAGIITCFEENQDFPLNINRIYLKQESRFNNMLLDGRYSKLEVIIEGMNPNQYTTRTIISAQTYLEITYDYFKKSIQKIGTPQEIKTLEAFIAGKKKLEMDKFHKYAHASQHKDEKTLNLTYNPLFLLNKQKYQESRPLPTSHMALLSLLANTNNTNTIPPNEFPWQIEKINWDEIKIADIGVEITRIENIPEQELLGEVLSKYQKKETKIKTLTTLLKEIPARRIESTIQYAAHNRIPTLTKQLKSQLTKAFQKVYSPKIPKVKIPEYNITAKINELEQKVIEFQPTLEEEEEQLYITKTLQREFTFSQVKKRARGSITQEFILRLFFSTAIMGVGIWAYKLHVKINEEPQIIVERKENIIYQQLQQLKEQTTENLKKNTTLSQPADITPTIGYMIQF